MVIKRTLKCGHEAEIVVTIPKPLRKRTRWPDMCAACKKERTARHCREWHERRRKKLSALRDSIAMPRVYEKPQSLPMRPAVRHVTVSDVQDLSDRKLESVLTKLVRGQLALTRIV